MSPDSLLKSRRFWTGMVAIGALMVLGLRGADVAWPLASIAIGTSAANAYQKRQAGAPDDAGDAK